VRTNFDAMIKRSLDEGAAERCENPDFAKVRVTSAMGSLIHSIALNIPAENQPQGGRSLSERMERFLQASGAVGKVQYARGMQFTAAEIGLIQDGIYDSHSEHASSTVSHPLEARRIVEAGQTRQQLAEAMEAASFLLSAPSAPVE